MTELLKLRATNKATKYFVYFVLDRIWDFRKQETKKQIWIQVGGGWVVVIVEWVVGSVETN